MKSHYAMILYPLKKSAQKFSAENEVIKSKESMIAQLTEEGFLGDYFSVILEGQEEKQTGYLVGDNFLKLVTFLGCSPHLSLTLPEDNSDWHHFCHVEIQEHSSPVFMKGLNTLKCSCPQCKSRLSIPLSKMQQWTPDSMEILCPKCQHLSLVEDLKWRHSAGFGSFFIVIHSVYPSEAVPTEKLMNLLSLDYSMDWDYFYYEQ
ncbi:MAG: zinc-ribbon domain-containing protein [Gammaproteobacteria bacterium]|nr:zinc-ribbon domain-containing protein [Gammaproteobacteria bacterium]